MKITITDDQVVVEGFDSTPLDGAPGHTCRTAAHEACAWGLRRLSEELEKSTAFYRTGDSHDRTISVEEEE